jgi:hypothetical protein
MTNTSHKIKAVEDTSEIAEAEYQAKKSGEKLDRAFGHLVEGLNEKFQSVNERINRLKLPGVYVKNHSREALVALGSVLLIGFFFLGRRRRKSTLAERKTFPARGLSGSGPPDLFGEGTDVAP